MKNLEMTSANFQRLEPSRLSFRPVTTSPQKPGAKEMRKAAQDFEALFVKQLLAAMRRTVPDGDPELKAPGSSIYESMLDGEFASHIAKSGRGLGLADMLIRQFEKAEGGRRDRLESD